MNSLKVKLGLIIFIIAVVGSTFVMMNNTSEDDLYIYTGRNENLVKPIIEKFKEETGINVIVRYGKSAQLVALLQEEGNSTKADLFWSVEAGSLGALSKSKFFTKLPNDILNKVPSSFQSPEGVWVATSARARVIAYNSKKFNEADLPRTLWGLSHTNLKLGWATTNASFQDFITGFRVLEGDEKTLEWLKAIKDLNPRVYSNNTAIVDAISRGEVDIGLVNHYYLHRFRAEHGKDFPVWYYHTEGDAASMINTAGVGIIKTSKKQELAKKFINFLHSRDIQQLFVDETKEYSVLATSDRPTNEDMIPYEEIKIPNIDLSELLDLPKTQELLNAAGVL